MKHIFTVVFLSFISLIFAQVPGYMGKRCTIVYSIWAHPSAKPVTDFFGVGNPYDDLSLNCTQALQLDYLVMKRTAICLGFQYSHLGLAFQDPYYNKYTYKGKDKFPAVVDTKGFSLGFKIFSSRKIAPIGHYIKGEALVLWNTLSYDPKGAYQTVSGYNSGSYQTTRVPVDEPARKINSSGGGAAISLGRQRVFYNRLVVDAGVRFAVVIAQEPYISGYGSEFRILDRVFYNQFVNFRLGLGFLAF